MGVGVGLAGAAGLGGVREGARRDTRGLRPCRCAGRLRRALQVMRADVRRLWGSWDVAGSCGGYGGSGQGRRGRAIFAAFSAARVAHGAAY